MSNLLPAKVKSHPALHNVVKTFSTIGEQSSSRLQLRATESSLVSDVLWGSSLQLSSGLKGSLLDKQFEDT